MSTLLRQRQRLPRRASRTPRSSPPRRATPAARRPLPSPRPYLTTDTAWYLLAVLATAISVFLFRPVLSQLEIGQVSEPVNSLPLAVRFVFALAIFDFLSFLVHRQLHRSGRLWEF